MATVVVSSAAERQYHALPISIRIRVEKIFVRLKKWPEVSGAKALSGDLAGRFRIRTGDYRVQFHVVRKSASAEHSTIEVIVEKVGHRDGFYED